MHGTIPTNCERADQIRVDFTPRGALEAALPSCPDPVERLPPGSNPQARRGNAHGHVCLIAGLDGGGARASA
ncbi:hypothetical protein MNEG_13672, partial [Monoraphidium neglectum]